MSTQEPPSTPTTSDPEPPKVGQFSRGRVRASDAEREQIAHILRTAMTEGRLTLEEGEERLAGVYAAAYREDLAPLTADLPGGGRNALADTPEVKDFVRRGLRRHASFVAVAAVVLIGLWALSPAQFFWPIFPLTFLVLGLLARIRFYRYARAAGLGPGGGWMGPPWQRGPWRHRGWR